MNAMTLLFGVGLAVVMALYAYTYTPSGKKWVAGE